MTIIDNNGMVVPFPSSSHLLIFFLVLFFIIIFLFCFVVYIFLDMEIISQRKLFCHIINVIRFDCNFIRKHPTRQILQYICFWSMNTWRIVCVLTKFLKKMICSNRIIFLVEIRMCYCGILRKPSCKFWCVLLHFTCPGK